jgi:hypothetical protein
MPRIDLDAPSSVFAIAAELRPGIRGEGKVIGADTVRLGNIITTRI